MQFLDGISLYLCGGIVDYFENIENCGASCLSSVFENEFDDLSPFIASNLDADGNSSLEIDFKGKTPGDILGVSIHDCSLTLTKMKRQFRLVMLNVHSDKFDPNSPFARAHQIDSIEKANNAFSNYQLAYKAFLEKKMWS